MSSKITVGKIVSSATETGWSQAYHAGGFTAVISVTEQEKSEEKQSLAAHGKKLLDTLVSEYFTLTTKDLETVRQAVNATIEKTPIGAHIGLVVAAVVKNVLYVVIAHEGRVLLKRGDKLGLLLSVKPDDSEKIASISGFLEVGDLVMLHTSAFGQIFPHDDLVQAFDNRTVEELAEFFAPKVHETQNGAASALIFAYHEDEQPLAEKKPLPEAIQEEAKKEGPLPGFEEAPDQAKPKTSFSHRQKLFLTITVILAIVLIGSIFVFLNRQQAARQQALFTAIYQPANAKFNDAKGLLDLNRALAIEDLQSAQQTLIDAKAKFPSDSREEKQILALLAQVSQTLTDAQKIPLLTATKAADTASPLLSFAKAHTGMYVTQDTNNFYAADNNAISSFDKKTNTSKKLITNGTDWKQIGGFDTYFGNFYVVDTKDGIDKYVSGGGGYGKSAYFAEGVSPDLSKAVSMSIDSSIYILTSNGSIIKYTKGTQDSFSVTGLDTPLKSPTEILTSADLDNVYVLDNGNSRVVVLKKDGGFLAQYASDQVKNATAIDVSEKNKKLYFLSSDTVYQLGLK